METSSSITAIVAALLDVQKTVSGTIKDKTGKVLTKSGREYEYNYSDLSSVLDECKGPLNEAGIFLLQSPSADATGVIVTTTLMHTSGEWIKESLYMPVTSATPQAYGSAITYCRRYGLQSMIGLKAEDDDGKKASEPVERKPNTAKQVMVDEFDLMPPEQQAALQQMAIAIVDLATNGEPALPYIEAHIANDDQETKMGLWSLLPSHVRTAINKEREKKAALLKAKAAA